MIFGGIRLRLPIPVSSEVAGYFVVGVAVILVGAGVWLLMEKFRRRAKADLPKPTASSSRLDASALGGDVEPVTRVRCDCRGAQLTETPAPSPTSLNIDAALGKHLTRERLADGTLRFGLSSHLPTATAPSVSTSRTAESYALETEAIKLMAMVHTRNEWIAFCNQFPDLARSELRKQLELFLPRAHIRLHASLAVRQLLLHNPKLEAALISKALIDLPGMDQNQQYEMMNALVQIWPHLEPQRKAAP